MITSWRRATSAHSRKISWPGAAPAAGCLPDHRRPGPAAGRRRGSRLNPGGQAGLDPASQAGGDADDQQPDQQVADLDVRRAVQVAGLADEHVAVDRVTDEQAAEYWDHDLPHRCLTFAGEEQVA